MSTCLGSTLRSQGPQRSRLCPPPPHCNTHTYRVSIVSALTHISYPNSTQLYCDIHVLAAEQLNSWIAENLCKVFVPRRFVPRASLK